MFTSPKLVYETIYLETTVTDVYKMLGDKAWFSRTNASVANALKNKILKPFFNAVSHSTIYKDNIKLLESITYGLFYYTPYAAKITYHSFLHYILVGEEARWNDKLASQSKLLKDIAERSHKPVKEIDAVLKNTYISIRKIVNAINHKPAGLGFQSKRLLKGVKLGFTQFEKVLKTALTDRKEFTLKTSKLVQAAKARPKKYSKFIQNIFAKAEEKAKAKMGKTASAVKTIMSKVETSTSGIKSNTIINNGVESLSKIGGKANTFFKSAKAPLLAGSAILLGGIAAAYKLVGKQAPIPWYRKQINLAALGLGGIAVIAILSKLSIRKPKIGKKFENDISSIMLETFNSVNPPLLESSLASRFSNSIKSVFMYPLKIINKVTSSMFTRFKDKTGFSFWEAVLLLILFSLAISVIKILVSIAMSMTVAVLR